MGARLASVATLVIGALSLVFGFVCFFMISARDPRGFIGVLFLAYGITLVSPLSAIAPLRLSAGAFLAWGILNLAAGLLALSGVIQFLAQMPQWEKAKALYVGGFWIAFGITLLRREPVARGRGWPLLAVLQLGVTPVALFLLIPAIVFTVRVRSSAHFQTSMRAAAQR